MLESIKSMINVRHSHQHQQSTDSKSSKLSRKSRKSHGSIMAATSQPDRIQTMMVAAQHGAKLAHVDIIFALFGCCLLVVYIFAALADESRSLPHGCKLCMRPWLQSRHPCALLEINCQARNLTGAMHEMNLVLSKVSPSLIRGLIFAHCLTLHVPPRVQEFSSLLMVVFNSTIVDWSDNAALTAHWHRQFVILLMVRVDFVEFPPGLLSAHFSLTLVDFEVHQSNLTAFPEARIEAFWPTDLQNLVVEYSTLTRVPRFLVKKQVVGTLSLAGNLIADVSMREVLATSCSRALLGHNPLQ